MLDLLLEEVWYPLFRDGPYTTGETFVYAAVFIFLAYYALHLFRKVNVKLDKHFYIGWTLWIVAMAIVRVLEDYSILTSRLFITPYIDFLFGGTALFLIVLFKHLDSKKIISFNHAWIASPFLLILPSVVFLPLRNFLGGAIVVVIVLFFFFALRFLKNTKKLKSFLSFENRTILLAHLMDASATYTAIAFFGAYEKHVLPSYLIGIFGPAIMFPLKIIVVGAVLYYLDSNSKDQYETKYIKLLVYSLGIGTGTRDLLQIMGYV
ncbi:MAG: DUF63 family protein [Candidatus Aenigmarchaeota archaeon]|nr:DUF63 family protein [Candidatus Aenigmarchaeota archaeon]